MIDPMRVTLRRPIVLFSAVLLLGAETLAQVLEIARPGPGQRRRRSVQRRPDLAQLVAQLLRFRPELPRSPIGIFRGALRLLRFAPNSRESISSLLSSDPDRGPDTHG